MRTARTKRMVFVIWSLAVPFGEPTCLSIALILLILWPPSDNQWIMCE